MILTPFASRSRYVGILAVACLISIARADNQDYTPSGGSWAKTGTHSYKHEGATFSDFRYSDENDATNTYKYEVGPPSGWSFVPSKTNYSGGTKIGDPTATYAGIKKVNDATGDPVSFILSMGGELTTPGGGSGTVTWEASAKSRFFWLTPIETIVIEGTVTTVGANGAPTESTWSVNSKSWKDWRTADSQPYKTSSVTLNRDMWDKMQWTPSPVPTGYLFPPVGIYNISAITTENPGARSASAIVRIVKIDRPAKNGLAIKWENSEKKYDSQVIKNNNLTISGTWSGASGGEWEVSEGSLADKNSSSTAFSYSTVKKGISLKLFFELTGTVAIDSRTIDVYEDYLELGRDNFGVDRLCSPQWRPLAKYSVSESDIPLQGHWNCHGGTDFLIGNGGTGTASEPKLQDFSLVGTTVQTTQGGSITLPSLQRGDVIVYFGSLVGIMHSQVVISSDSTYSANNEQMAAPGLPANQSWKWAECPPGLWATNTLNHPSIRPITIKVYRKN